MVEKKFVPISIFQKRARRFTHGGLVALFLFIYFCVTRTSHDFGQTRSYSTQVTAKVGETFPRKIWQIWKVNPLEFDGRDIEVARSWTVKNPGYRYEVLTDQNDLDYVETNFGPLGENRPDIVETYRSLTARIIKADLLRYLVMYIEGGVYADIDVEALRPVERFVPSTHDERDIGM
ncbi:initiation-specific alpha-1,6-mannosyltransferase, partial [Aspergillus udagawae]